MPCAGRPRIHRRPTRYLTNDEFWAEFEDEIKAYEEANGLEPLVD